MVAEEVLFSGTVEVGAETEGASSELEDFSGKLDSFVDKAETSMKKFSAAGLARDIQNTGSSILTMYDKHVRKIDEVTTEVRDYSSAIDAVMESQKVGFDELFGVFTLGLRQMRSESGNAVTGISLLSQSLADAGHVIGPLKGVSGALDSINGVVQTVTNPIAKLIKTFKTGDVVMTSLIDRSRELSIQLRTQKIAWEAQESQTNENILSVIKLAEKLKDLYIVFNTLEGLEEKIGVLDEFYWENATESVLDLKNKLASFGVDVGGSLDTAKESFGKTFASLRAEMDQTLNSMNRMRQQSRGVFESAGVEEFRIDTDNATSSIQTLELAEQKLGETHKTRTRLQRALATQVNSAFQSMGQALTYVESGMQATGKASEKYLARANVAVKNVNLRLRVMRVLGAEIPDEMQKNFSRVQTIVKGATAETKRLNKELAEKESRTSIDGKTESLRGLKGALSSATKASGEYSRSTREVARSNEMLAQYIRPEGSISTGTERIGDHMLYSGQAAADFSLSLGSIIGVAGAVGGALGSVHPAFSAIIVGAARLADQFSRSFSAMISVSGTASQRIKASLKIISSSMTGFGLTAIGLITKMGLLGAEVKTLEITMTTIARNLAREAGVDVGRMEDYIVSLRDEIKNAGIDTKEATVALSQFLRARLPVEKISDLANAAKNLGVTVANMSSSEVFGRFIQFIQTGNSALLDAIGVAKNASIMMDEYAKSIGKTTKALTTREKQEALIQGIIKETETVQGVYNEAMTTAGKQLSSMKRYFFEAMLVIGRQFEPTLAKLIMTMNKLLKWFNALDPEIHKQIANYIKLTAVFGTLVGVITAAAPALRALIPIIKLVGRSILTSMPWLIAISVAVAAIGLAAAGLKKLWDKNFGGIQDSVKELGKVLKEELGPAIEFVKWLIGTIKEDAAGLLSAISESFGGVAEKATNLVDTIRSVIGPAMMQVKAIVFGVFSAISQILRAFTALIRGDTEEATSLLKKAVTNAFTAIYIFVKKIVLAAVDYGKGFVVNFFKGFVSVARKLISQVMSWFGNALGAFIKPGSPPKKGPLSQLVNWGKGVMETYLRAFKTADFGILKDVLSPIQTALKSAVSAGKLDPKKQVKIFSAVRQQVASLLADFRKTGKINEEIMGNIQDRLGKGGKEYVEYIRRVLEYQKAVQNLQKVEQEVAEAQSAGFVSKDLKDRLQAAKDEVDARKDAVEWQREFLAAMQDTADIQAEMLKSLKDIADKMGKVGTPEMEPEAFEISIPDEAAEIDVGINTDDISNDLADLIAEISGYFSEEKVEATGFLEGARTSIQEFLALPLSTNLATIWDWLSRIARIQFASLLSSIFGLATKIETLTGLPARQWFVDVYTAVTNLKNTILEFVNGPFMEWWGALKLEVQGAWQAIQDALAELGVSFEDVSGKAVLLKLIGFSFRVMGKMITIAVKVVMGIILGIARTVRYVIHAITGEIRFFRGLFKAIVALFQGDFESFKTNISDAWEGLKEFIGSVFGAIIGFFTGFFEGALPGWADKFREFTEETIPGLWESLREFFDQQIEAAKDWGTRFVQSLSDGFAQRWASFKQSVKDKLGWLKDVLPFSEPKDPTSPLRGLGEAGKAIMKNIMDGMASIDPSVALSGQLATAVSDASGGVTNNRTTNFGAGAFTLVFPSVTSREDAYGIENIIQERVDRAQSLGYFVR